MDSQPVLDAEMLSIEMRLLIVFIAADTIDPLSCQHLFRQTDWERFVELARHHRVYPYIYTKIKGLSEQWVPQAVIQRLGRDYRRNTLQMLQLCGEMDSIGRKFAERKIRLLHLKGPVIAEELYGDISLRTSCDIDFLIPIGDLTHAESQLLSLGYVKDDYIQTVLNDWKWRHHHITFTHPVKGVKVEVHWRLNPAPSKEPGFEELWARRRQSSLISHPTYYLGQEDLFLFLVSHGARHGWSRIRWLLDIKKWLIKSSGPSELVALLRKRHYLHLGGQALALASQLLQAPIGTELQFIVEQRKPQKLAKDAMFYLERIVNLHTPPLPEDVDRYHKRHQFSLLGNRQKLLFILSFLFPFPKDAETMPLPKSLHFLYFPLRPFLWAWRKAAGQSHRPRQ